MSNITFFLHIGATKTGTTALQRFLEQHSSKLLNEYGVLYPNFYDNAVDAVMKPGVNYWHGKYFQNNDSSNDVALFQKCIRVCEKRSLQAVVISHEALLNNWADRMGELFRELDVNVKIICYVRRQDHHLESAWKQLGHRLCSASEMVHHKSGWGRWRWTNWYERIAPWTDYFGKENIIIRPYEKEQLPKGIFSDFLDILNIDWKGEIKLEREADMNSGFSRDVMEVLSLNKDFYKIYPDQRLYNMFSQLLKSEYGKEPFESYNLLSPSQRIELLKEYEPSNQKLAREYLNREDGRLFYEPWPKEDDPWVPYEGLSIEKLVPIMTKMIYELYSRQQALESRMRKQASTNSSFENPLYVMIRRLFRHQ